MADDTPLLRRDRYDPAALLAQLSGQTLGKDHNARCYWFNLDGEPTPAYVPDDPETHEAARTRLADFLTQIREIDNSVQTWLEAEHRSAGHALQDCKLAIGWIRVNDDDERTITIRYWGEIVNTELNAVFQRSPDGRWALAGQTRR